MPLHEFPVSMQQARIGVAISQRIPWYALSNGLKNYRQDEWPCEVQPGTLKKRIPCQYTNLSSHRTRT